jgi:Tryptophan-associated transmembrane protein (Trp_oprn_chp)
VSGIDVTGGKWALAMGIVAIVLGIVAFLRVSPRVVGIGLIVAGLIGGGWALYDTTQADVVKERAIEEAVPRLGSVEGASAVIGQYIDTSFGAGIWISIVGGLIAIGGGIVLLTAGGSMTETSSRMGAAAGSGFTPTEPPPASPPPAADRPADRPADPAPMPPAEPSPPPSGGGESSPSGGGSEPTP